LKRGAGNRIKGWNLVRRGGEYEVILTGADIVGLA